jgi:hypothetical protein
LEKDFFIRRNMHKDGFLPVSIIANFPRIQNLTQDFAVVVKGIQMSPELEMNEDRSCVRTKKKPTYWPIDNKNSAGLPMPPQTPMFPRISQPLMPSAPIAYVYRTPIVAVPTTGIIPPVPLAPPLIPLSAPITVAPSVSTGEMLNPNVPEFIPKAVSKSDESKTDVKKGNPENKSPKPETPESDAAGDNQANVKSETNHDSKAKDEEKSKITVGGLTEAQFDELWQEVKKKPKPVTRVKRRLPSVDGGELDFNNVQFQFEEDEQSQSPAPARTRTYSSSRYSV